MIPQNIAEVLELYHQHLRTKFSAQKVLSIFGQTQTAMMRFTLPAMGGPVPQGAKLTLAEIEMALCFLRALPLKQIAQLRKCQEQGFARLATPKASRYTYRSRLNSFLEWVEEQPWSATQAEQWSQNVCPRKRHGYGNTKNKAVTNRRLLPAYALAQEQISPSLQAGLDAFTHFFVAEHVPARKGAALRSRTVRTYVDHMLRLLGWWYVKKQVPIADLSLDLLVQPVELRYREDVGRARREAEEAAEALEVWLCDYLEFLIHERHYQSHASQLQAIIAIHALVRYQYARQTKDSKYSDIPAMQVLRERLRTLQKKIYNDPPVADIAKKWLDLPTVLEEVVTPLRLECAYRNVAGDLRPPTAIARSFQLFLVWGLLTFRPPRRQQEFRGLKLALSCPLPRPTGLREGEWIHPLPPERAKDKEFGYLFKEGDTWYEDKTPESYKTGKAYGHQRLAVVNPRFPDGKCFYDYLEAFLYGYYRYPNGAWISGGQASEAPDADGQWMALRLALKPDTDHVFVKPMTGQAHSTGSFYRMVMNSSHRLTGQLMTPHLLRDVFATWFLDKKHSEQDIQSLAYAMGHSVEVLRRIYDRRNPQEKVRPIQAEVLAMVNKHVI